MLKRKIYGILAAWMGSSPRKALLLMGAHQTGKTFAVRQFAHNAFASIAEVNLLDGKSAAGMLAGATDTDDFLSRLSLVSRTSLRPGQTLIFLDEVQEAPDLITVVKFLVEDGRFPVILSWSMLETELKGFRSFPVGYVQIKRMFPLDFEELFWPQGVPTTIIEDIRGVYREKAPLDGALHSRLLSLY